MEARERSDGSVSWVKVESGTMRMFCERCGQSYTPALPCPLGVFVDIIKSFGRTHRWCKEKKLTSV